MKGLSPTESGTWSLLAASLAALGSRPAVESAAYSCASLFSRVSLSAAMFLCSSCSFRPIFCCSSRTASVCLLSRSSRSRSSCRNPQVNMWRLKRRRTCHLTSQEHCSSSWCSTFWSLSSFSTCLPRTFLTCRATALVASGVCSAGVRGIFSTGVELADAPSSWPSPSWSVPAAPELPAVCVLLPAQLHAGAASPARLLQVLCGLEPGPWWPPPAPSDQANAGVRAAHVHSSASCDLQREQ